MKTSIPSVLITFLLVCFGLSPGAHAVVPPPDGGYPGGNTAEGTSALLNLTTGINNTAVGANALRDDTTGYYNVAVGSGALASNRTGNFNMAIGTEALTNNNANLNVAIGFRVGYMNTRGHHLTGVGAGALRDNTSGTHNTAVGADALREGTGGSGNTAVGSGALLMGGAGLNTAIGADTLPENTAGFSNTATGYRALYSNTEGYYNTAIGKDALSNNTEGGRNTAIGVSAGFNQTTGTNNVYIGTTVFGAAGENNACYIASIFGQTSPSGVPVVINSNNKLGTVTSSKRFKENIEPMEKASEALFALKPVAFRYKKEIDLQGIPQFGLVAEDVEKANPDLVLRDKEGKPYTVRYDAVNAMLLNEFLKEHRKNEEQQKQIDVLTAQLKEQAAQIQKVSAQLEASKPAPQVVNNP